MSITVINAENAAHKSEKFSAMATRTRHEYLKDLATNYVTSTTLETGAKGKGKTATPVCSYSVHVTSDIFSNVNAVLFMHLCVFRYFKVDKEEGESSATHLS